MKGKKSKTRTVGLRVTKEQEEILAEIQAKAELSKTDILLKGLDLLAQYYRLEEEQGPMEIGLRQLEQDALHHMESLKRIRRKQDAIQEFVSEIRFADEIIDTYGCDKSMLIQILLEVQKKKNWLPKPVLLWISERLDVPMKQIKHIASFYTFFSLEPQGRHTCQVCTGTACHVRGSEKLLTRIERVMDVGQGETDDEEKFTLKTVNCLGCCALGPVMKVDEDHYSDPTVKELKNLIEQYD